MAAPKATGRVAAPRKSKKRRARRAPPAPVAIRPAPSPSSKGDKAWRADAEQVAIALGWFSIGLGLVEILKPSRLTRAFDTHHQEPIYRLYGARELAAGAGLLLNRDKSPWLYARLAGDALDAVTLALGLGGRRQGNVMAGLAAVAGVTALDLWAARALGDQERRAITAAGPHKSGGRAWRHGIFDVERSVTINKDADTLRDLWMDPPTLPRIMAHIADIEQLGAGRARWTVPTPLGPYSWETQLVSNDQEDALRWETDGANALIRRGVVRSATAPKKYGTVMTAALTFDPPGGMLGRGTAALLGDQMPGALVDKTLLYFKALAETGEIPTTAGQPAARRNTR